MNGTHHTHHIKAVATACTGIALLLAGACKHSNDANGGAGAVTPPASATFGSPGSSTPASSAAPSSAPPSNTSSPTRSPVTLEPSSTPTRPASPPSTSNDAATRFGTLVGQWQTAQSTFLGRATAGGDSIAAERKWAKAFLTAERRFAAALDPAHWPGRAAGSLRALRTASNTEQRKLQAMTAAAGPSDFTGLLGSYSTGVTAENRAIRTVRQALG